MRSAIEKATARLKYLFLQSHEGIFYHRTYITICSYINVNKSTVTLKTNIIHSRHLSYNVASQLLVCTAYPLADYLRNESPLNRSTESKISLVDSALFENDITLKEIYRNSWWSFQDEFWHNKKKPLFANEWDTQLLQNTRTINKVRAGRRFSRKANRQAADWLLRMSRHNHEQMMNRHRP